MSFVCRTTDVVPLQRNMVLSTLNRQSGVDCSGRLASEGWNVGQVQRRHFLFATSALLAAPFARPQESRKVRRIGYLFLEPRPKPNPRYREALRRAGWEDGKNLQRVDRSAEGNPERMLELAEELVRLDVELIVAIGNHASDAARRATKTIPIVMWGNMFPVERGLITSLARPGGNVTGTVWYAQPDDTSRKMYQILREAAPMAKRSVSFADPTDPQMRFYDLTTSAKVVAAMGFTDTQIMVTRPEDLDAAFRQIVAIEAEVFNVRALRPILARYRDVAAFAIERKLITISDVETYVHVGGLLSYGPDVTEVMERTVSYIDRILRGAKPGDLPVEQASKYVMALNAKTANAIRFKPPASFMLRVDRTIE